MAKEPNPRRPGRFISAFRVLMGRMTTPAQIQADWLEWELVLGGVLDRFGALLARQAKAEKKRVEQQLELQGPDHMENQPRSGKAELYARANQLRGFNAKVKMAPIDAIDVSVPMPNSEELE